MKLSLPGWSVKALAALTLSAGCVAPASAVLINQWTYTFRAGWDNFTPTPPGSPFGVVGDRDAPDPPAGLGLPTRLRWGATTPGGAIVAENQSQLIIHRPGTDPDDPINVSGNGGITSGPPPTLQTSDPIGVPTFDITHRNNVIFFFDQALDETDLVTNVTLQPLVPHGATPATAPTLTFRINFEETENADPDCPVSGGPELCSDIFVITNLGALDQFIPGAAFGLGFADVNYIGTITLEGLGPLSDEACQAAGADPGCQGLITNENVDNTFTAFFEIHAVVPEPSSVALVGLVLIGLGGLVLRRKS